MTKWIKPVHPGEILLEDFLEPTGMSRSALARAIGVPAPRINDIVLCRRGITADTAMRLAAFIGTTPEFWISLQASYELDVARQKADLVNMVEKIEPYQAETTLG